MPESSISTRQLLAESSIVDLQPLVGYIKKAKRSEKLTKQTVYKRHCPDHRMYSDNIYNEIRRFGGNSFANGYRGRGVNYRTVVQDAAKKVGVKRVKSRSVIEIEEEMIDVLLRKALKKTSSKNREALEEELYKAGLNEKDLRAFLSGGTLAGLLGAQVYRTIMYRASDLVVYAVASHLLVNGVRMGSSFVAGRTAPIALGPIGWILAGTWTAVDIAGPGYRVTVPCVLHIAMLRQKRIHEDEAANLKGAFDDE